MGGHDLSTVLDECKKSAKAGYKIASGQEKNLNKVLSVAKEKVRSALYDFSNSPCYSPEATSLLEGQLSDIEQAFLNLSFAFQEDLENLRSNMSKFSITLFGRTMAGKSTLMEILTEGNGETIGKGAQRTTRDIRKYTWNELEITDVPGIGAFEGEDDEQIAFEAAKTVPLSISYEFDPCDSLKAWEFQLKRDVPGWKKTKQDDLLSMRTGIMGYKGRIHYHCAPCIDGWLQTLGTDIPKTDLFGIVAGHIDDEIFRNYRLFPNNYIASDLLEGSTRYAGAGKYSEEEKAVFENYILGQIAKLPTDNRFGVSRDDAYLRECMLVMYANPAKNHLEACSRG